MYFDKYKYQAEFFSKLNPIAVIIGLLIGTLIFLLIFNVFGPRKFRKIILRLNSILFTLIISSTIICVAISELEITDKLFISLLFSLISLPFIIGALRNKRNLTKIRNKYRNIRKKRNR